MKSNTNYYLSQFNTTDSTYKEPSISPPMSPHRDTMSHHLSDFTQIPSYQFPNNYHQVGAEHPMFNDSLEIRVDGIPSTGAKSRVETQIKLCLSLVTKDGAKAPYWSYIRIPDAMLARSKLRKSQQQKLLDGSAAAMVSDESKVLDLEARVVCESDENKKIKMCQGCVRRERKRAERKKDSKPSAHDLNANIVDEAFERDRLRILLFNCEPLVNFSTGDAILPTRITCYCRHHNERIGFRVRFALRNDKGLIVASGESPPIMITDDHKSSKQRAPSISISRKRRRAVLSEAEDEYNALATPVSSRRNSVSGSEAEASKSPNRNVNSAGYFSTSTPSVLQHFATSPLPTPGEEGSVLTVSSSTESISPKTPALSTSWQNMMSYSGPVQLPVNDMSNLHQRRTQNNNGLLQNSNFDEHDVLLSPPRRRRVQDNVIPDACSPSLLTVSSMQSQQNQDLMYSAADYSAYQTMSSPSTPPHLHMTQPGPMSMADNSLSPSMISHHAVIPTLDSIVPSQGPTTGGVEITIVGENFHPGLTLMFGNRAATNVCCNANSIVCILPAAEHNGPVVVSFKEHPLMRTSPVPPLFNYYESAEQDIHHLSLQAVGLEERNPQTGYFQTQPHIQSSPLSTPSYLTAGDSSEPSNNNFYDATSLSYEQNVEVQVLSLLSGHNYPTYPASASVVTSGGQNLLHLASYLNYPSLVAFLIAKIPTLVHSQDRNGLSPLHFACHSKANLVIQLLLKAGANVGMVSNIGTPVDLVSTMLTHDEYIAMEKQMMNNHMQSPDMTLSPVSWLPSLFVYAASQYYQRNNITSSPCIDLLLNNNVAAIPIQNGDSMVYHF